MTESEPKDAGGRHEPLRVIDRRTFTPEGERRQPDAVSDEGAPHLPRATSAPTGATPAERTSAGPARDPDPVASAHFQNLILNLARQAAANLGATHHPLTGQVEVDMEAAQQMIGLLQSIHLKTRGNLTAEENELLEGLIGDLQMQYVTLRSKSTTRP